VQSGPACENKPALRETAVKAAAPGLVGGYVVCAAPAGVRVRTAHYILHANTNHHVGPELLLQQLPLPHPLSVTLW
jgi:hypothetical protein